MHMQAPKEIYIQPNAQDRWFEHPAQVPDCTKYIRADLMPEWIDCGKRMPPEKRRESDNLQGHHEWTESEPVLALDSMYGPCVDYTRNGHWASEKRGGYSGQVVHGIIAWMPIPEYKEATPACQEKTVTFTDLGLPSGNLWATETDGRYYNWHEAVQTFGKHLPSPRQFQELIEQCSWKWDENKSGFKVTGPNGNSIFLAAVGWRDQACKWHSRECGYYWTNTEQKPNFAYLLFLDPDETVANLTRAAHEKSRFFPVIQVKTND